MAIGGVIQIIQGVATVIQLLPTLLQSVRTMTQQLEEDSPGGGGEAQKPVVVGMVKASLDAADKFATDGELLNQPTKDAIVQVAGEATDLVVGMYNAIGTFKHGTKA